MSNLKLLNNSQMSYNSLKEQFIFFKKAQGLSERTLKDYKTTFGNFEKYYHKKEVDLEELKKALLEMLEHYSKGAPATFNVPYSNLMCFFNWAVKNEYLNKNPLKQTGLQKKRDDGKARAIPQDIVKKLFDIIDLNTFVGLRDYVILVLMLDSGIRPCEAFRLTLDDLDLSHYAIRIKPDNAKTRVFRMLPLSYQTVQILQKFLAIREEDWLNYLFLTIKGTQMKTNTYELRIKHYSKLLGYKFTPYDLRHTFSILYLKNGGNVFSLQKILGHTNISMTKRYVNLAYSDIAEQHLKSSPINNFIKRSTKIKRKICL